MCNILCLRSYLKMESKFLHKFVILLIILSISFTFCNSYHSKLVSSNISNIFFPDSNQEIDHDVLKNDLRPGKPPQLKLDKLFGLDTRIFDDYLKHEDLAKVRGQLEDDDFENWNPSLGLQRDFPVYISGFDYQDRPKWGKWRFDKYATGDDRKAVLFEKYMRYLAYTAVKSQAIRSTDECRVTQHAVLFDPEGIPPDSLTNRKILQLQLKVFRSSRHYYEKYVSKAICINVNPVSEILLNLLYPFFNRLLSRFEIYGTNKYIWTPQLLKNFPKDQIPEWYGGNKGFVPFLRFG